MATIDLVYFNAGGGHRASALALQAVIHEQRLPWQVRLVNLTALLDPRDTFRRLTGFEPEDLYNQRLARGWTFGLAHELKLLQRMIRVAHPSLVRVLQRHWLRTEPDLVVSLIPNFNRALCQSLAQALPGVPYLTVLTDLADYPPSFWIEPGQAQHLVCGTPRAAEQALAMGVAAQRLHRTSGMIIRPDFYAPQTQHRDQARRALGFDPQRPVGLVMFGGHGSTIMRGIARRLADTQLILVCGHNAALAESLRAQPSQARHHVIGFSPNVAGLMQCADFFIGKPGPGSLSEAVHQRLPVIVVRNRWTMPQERYNTEWVTDNGLGVVLSSFGAVRSGVADVIARLPELRANLARQNNRAVFEIPQIIAGLLDQASRATMPALQRAEMR